MNILDLPNMEVVSFEENEDNKCFIVKNLFHPSSCSHCGSYPAELTRWSTKDQTFMDLPIHGKRVGLIIRRQRWRCKSCAGTFFEPISWLDEKRRATRRLVQYIEKQATIKTFASVAEDVGVSAVTVKNIFNDHIRNLEKSLAFKTPTILGIDEIHLTRKPRCVITNIEQHTIIEMLPDRHKATVIGYLHNLPDKQNVRLVTMDMWEPYRQAVREVLPHSQIIVDKFHVISMANKAVDQVRKATRDSLTLKQRRGLMHDRFLLQKKGTSLTPFERMKLESWTLNFSALGLAYKLKEDFHGIAGTESRKEAIELYEAWKDHVTADVRSAYQPLMTAIENWQQEICAYFDQPTVTNAYTESINSLIRLTNRIGRGYSFEAIRAKILFSENLYKGRKPRFSKEAFFNDSLSNIKQVFTTKTPVLKAWSSGVDIEALINLLEANEF